MNTSLSTHLTWDPQRAVEAKEAVQELEDHPGLGAILEAVEQRETDLTSQLLVRSPDDSGAEYADIIGQIKGLREVPMIVRGVIENGRRAEHTLRENDES